MSQSSVIHPPRCKTFSHCAFPLFKILRRGSDSITPNGMMILSSSLIRSSYRAGSKGRLVGSLSCQNILGIVRSDEDHHCEAHTVPRKRLFHSTSKNEILPFLAVGGAVLVIGRYSWKALDRMDDEWEDYQYQLKQYERQRLKDAENSDKPTTIGVDVGSLFLKLSTLSANKPELVTTSQGDRYRFTGILTGGDENSDEFITGNPALEKFFYQPLDQKSTLEEPFILPYRELQKASQADASSLVQKVFVPAVREAMERLSSSNALEGGQTLRTVLTLPPTFYNKHGETIFQNYHDDTHHTTTVPDPVAAIWGAQVLDLIPTPQSKEDPTSSILVVDVGGLVTTISLVRNDMVVASCTLDNIGGESYVQQLVYRILKEAEDETMNTDAMVLSLIHTSARSSTLELVNKTQSKVHIPFLFMGRKENDPHLDMTISRTVLEQTVQDYWTSHVIPKLVDDGVLSAALPPPTNPASLFTSAVTRVLEDAQETPNGIQHILMVGGGSKHKLLEQACKDGIEALMGPSHGKIILPETSLRAELTVLGASSLLPNFDYSYENGLEHIIH